MPGAQGYQAFFLVGPTAVGKTAVAQRLAEQRQADILSADSMLVYRGLDIGTAKPSVAERNGVRYWGVDMVEPSQPYNVAAFRDEARRCFKSAASGGRPVIVAGGTGLYVKTLLEGMDELPSVAPGVREKWQAVLDREGTEGLRAALRRLNPAWLSALADPFNNRRLLRALELVEAGCAAPPALWRGERGRAVVVGLDLPRDELVKRITERVSRMYGGGLLDEVRALRERGWDAAGTAGQAIGYAEAVACLDGRLSLNAAMEETCRRTRQLAKRQMTWFRHQLDVAWLTLTPDADVPAIAARVSDQWRQTGPCPVVL